MNDEERRQWVLNDEDLYWTWKGSTLSMRDFLKVNRSFIDGVIKRALDRPPAK